MFQVNNKEVNDKQSGAFDITFEQILHLFAVFLLLTLVRRMFLQPAFTV